MAKPAVDTAWATTQKAINVTDKNGKAVVVLNRLEPTSQYKSLGCLPNVPIFGDAINYKLYADHQMLEWLRQREVGAIIEVEDGAKSLAQIIADHGGTWIDLGTVSRGYSGGSVTVRGFKKTA